MRLFFRPEAKADMNGIYDYLLEVSESIQAAHNVINKIRKSCDILEVFPFAGRATEHLAGDVRVLISADLATIFYSLENDTVEILRVFYKGRDF